MARSTSRSHSPWGALAGLGWPLLIGSAAASLFYILVFRGPLNTPVLHRYFAGHPVSVAATWMFWVGLAALSLKLADILGQFRSAHRIVLPAPASGAQHRVEDCGRLLDWLDRLPARLRRSYLANRLYEALSFVEREGSAEGLEEELKYLAETDAASQHESYSLVRIIIWATPMLGFLGTVVGITRALGDLDPQELATSIQTAMEGLLAGLYVAFDTTALALSLSIILMFVQFLVERVETHLLATVDARAGEELGGRFARAERLADPRLAPVQAMAERVIAAADELVRRQAAVWQATIDAAHQQWSALTETTSQQLTTGLETALDKALGRFADRLSGTEQAAAERLDQRWAQWQTSLSTNARALVEQQRELTRQTELIQQVLAATGDVVRLEKSLNENLRLLAGAKHFEDTVMSLAAAIHLLNARLGDAPGDAPRVELNQDASQGRAA